MWIKWMSFSNREENKWDAYAMWLQHAKFKYYLELPDVVEKMMGVLLLPKGISFLRRDSRSTTTKEDWEDSEESLAIVAVASACLEELGYNWFLLCSSRGRRVGRFLSSIQVSYSIDNSLKKYDPFFQTIITFYKGTIKERMSKLTSTMTRISSSICNY